MRAGQAESCLATFEQRWDCVTDQEGFTEMAGLWTKRKTKGRFFLFAHEPLERSAVADSHISGKPDYRRWKSGKSKGRIPLFPRSFICLSIQTERRSSRLSLQAHQQRGKPAFGFPLCPQPGIFRSPLWVGPRNPPLLESCKQLSAWPAAHSSLRLRYRCSAPASLSRFEPASCF